MTFLQQGGNMMQSVHITRVLRYFGHLLRRKNATGWANGKRESASIRQVGRCLVDPFAQGGQISIERRIVERTQFDLHQTSILRDRAGKLVHHSGSQYIEIER